MADRPLVYNEPLCFIFSKFAKLSKKAIAKGLIDFTVEESISLAKSQLLKDVENLQLTNRPPHIPARRDCNLRIEREVKDIFEMIEFLDREKQLDNLPRYVTDNPDNMPSILMFDGDLGFLLKRLEKIDERMAGFTSSMDTIMHNVNLLHNQASSMASNTSWPSLHPVRRAHLQASTSSTAVAATAPLIDKTRHGSTSSTGPSASQSVAAQLTATATNVNNEQLIADQLFHADGTNWANIASTPDLEFNSLTSSAHDHDNPFILVERKKHGMKRHKPDTSESQTVGSHRLNTDMGDRRATNRRRPLAVGHAPPRLDSPGHVSLSAASKQSIDRSVYYIDNIGPSYSADDVHKFVSSMSVRVLSCFEVKPRKRRIDFMPDRKAFRLCIVSGDRDKLVDENRWPQGVTISDWYYKPRESGNTGYATSRTPARDHSATHRGSHSRRNSGDDVTAASAATAEAASIPTDSASSCDGSESRQHDKHLSTSSSDDVTNIAPIVTADDAETSVEFMDADATVLSQDAAAESDTLTSSLILHDGGFD